jgi:hypothetical protein
VLFAASLLLLQAAPARDPDLLLREDRGISIRKPAKNASWEFKPNGRTKEAQLVLVHVDGLSIEIYHQDLGRNNVNYDPKLSLEAFWKELPFDGTYREAKLVKKIDYLVLPGRAASGVRCWYLDMKMKLEDGSPLEWRRHCFVGHENRSGYFLDVLGPAGQPEKLKKDVDLILSSIRTYRIPKDQR